MARIELPSGNWVEYRDNLMAKDKFAVQDAVILTITSNDVQEVTGAIQMRMRNALLRQVITGWSFALPIPSMNGGADIGDTLSLDDYNVLEEAVDPLLQKVSFAPNREASSK
jgi:hypothetical protein